jgi:ferredoxin
MKFAVNLNACENHGQCSYVAPELFELDDDGELTYRREAGAEPEYVSAPVPRDAEEHVTMAADLCPMQAIRILG